MKELFHYKILLVYDNRENFFSISSILKRSGYYCEIAFSEKEALQFLLKSDYGLIVFDISTTMQKGFELAGSIKRNCITKGVPMVFLSEKSIPKEFSFKGYETDMIGYLMKPFDENTLVFKVRNFLLFYHAFVQLEKANKALEKKAVQAKISFQDLYYSLPQTVFIINRSGIVVNINRTGMLSCGISAKDMLQKHYKNTCFLVEILGASEKTVKFKSVFELKDGKKNVEFRLENPDKSIFYGEAVVCLAIIDGEGHIQVSVNNLTEKKKAEELLKLNFLEISNSEKINTSIIQDDSINKISDVLLNSLASITSINGSRVYLYDKKNSKLNLVGELLEKNIISTMEQKFGIKLPTIEPPLLEGTLFKKLVDQKQSLITSNKSVIKQLLSEHTDNYIIQQLAGWARDFMNAVTCGVLPLMSEGDLLGIITFSSPKILLEEEKQMVLRFAQQATKVLAFKKNELALAISEERFELAMLGANDGIWDWDLFTDEVYYSPRWKSMFGYKENELENNLNTWKNLLHKDDKENAIKVVNEYLEGKRPEYETEFRIKHKDGHDVHILNRGRALKDKDGKFYRMTGTYFDNTEQKKYELFLKQINDSVSVKTGSSYFSEFTRFCCETLGVKYAMVGQYHKSSNSFETISFREESLALPNLKYDVSGTPCGLVMDGRMRVYPENVQSFFPKDDYLKNLGIESYIGVPLLDEANAPIGILVLMDNKPMTEISQKQTLLSFLAPRSANELYRNIIGEKLRESEERFDLAMQGANDGLWDWNLLTNEVYFSPRWKSMLGYTVNELEDNVSTWENLLHTDDKERSFRRLHQYFDGIHAENKVEFRMKHKNGTYVDILAKGQGLHDDKGQLYRMIGTNSDITERKKAEEEILKQKDFTETIFNNLPSEIAVFDTNHKYTFVNSKSISDPEIREWLIGKNDYDYCRLKGIDNAMAIKRSKFFADMMRSKAEVEWVDQYLTKEGKTKYVLRKFFPVVENNKVQFVIGYGVDITERKKEDQKLLKSEYMLAEAQRIGKIGSWEFDMVKNTVSWSQEMYQIYQCNPATFTPTLESLISLLPAEHREPMGNWIAASMSGVKQSYLDFHLDFPDGSRKFIRGYGEVFFNEKGKPIRAIGIAQDITLIKKVETQLLKTVKELNDKNNELMQFNYIVSHNLRAPIAHILGLANIINMPNLKAEEKPKIFEFVKTAADKMDELVKDLNIILAARSPLNAKKENVSLPSLIQRVSHTLENQISESNCAIEIDLADDAKELFTIKSYMESILYNLVNNAIKYKMPMSAPKLTISTKKLNDNILINLSDNGRGIDLTKHGEDIFGLYKRFHMDVEGKGLGLHMTKTQIEALGGKIEIQSSQNEGTTFIITLPV